MEISKRDLPDLRNKNSLVIATGTHVAKVYELKNGRILKKPSIDIPNVWKTDKDGIRRRMGRGTIWGTASDYQQKDDNIKVEFIHQLKKELKDLLQNRKDLDSLYIFAPKPYISAVRESLPKIYHQKIEMEYPKNLAKSAPDELLKKIEANIQRQRGRYEILKPQTAKILSRKKVRNNKKK